VTDMPIPLRLSLSPICLSPYWLNSSVIFSPGGCEEKESVQMIYDQGIRFCQEFLRCGLLYTDYFSTKNS
jgi:hypothetical protein